MFEYDERKFFSRSAEAGLSPVEAVFGTGDGTENTFLQHWNGAPGAYVRVESTAAGQLVLPVAPPQGAVLLFRDHGPHAEPRGTDTDYLALAARVAERANVRVRIASPGASPGEARRQLGTADVVICIGSGSAALARLTEAPLPGRLLVVDPDDITESHPIAEQTHYVLRQDGPAPVRPDRVSTVPTTLRGFSNILSLRSGEFAMQRIVAVIEEHRRQRRRKVA